MSTLKSFLKCCTLDELYILKIWFITKVTLSGSFKSVASRISSLRIASLFVYNSKKRQHTKYSIKVDFT